MGRPRERMREHMDEYLEHVSRLSKEQVGQRKINRRNDDSYHLLVENLHDGIMVLNKDDYIAYVNPRMAEILGYTVGEMLGRSVFSFVDESVVELHVEKLERRKRGIKEQYESEYLRKDGGRVYVSIESAPLYDDNGNYMGSAGCVQDITNRKEVEKLKDEFINLVSHEFHSPLTVIIGAVNTVLDKEEHMSREEIRQLLQDAAWEADILSNLLENILEISRYQANRLFLYLEPTSVTEVARSAIKKLSRRKLPHQFLIDIPTELPPICVDQFRMERILYNLLENATKYSPDGSEIRISAKAEGEWLTIGVRDKGIGISISDQDKLFKPFQRLNNSDGTDGSGLGLFVCLRLIEAHGGRIWVESEADAGSTFYFTVPLK